MPGTSNAHWSAQALDPTIWEQPMGHTAGLLTWSQYTHMSWIDIDLLLSVKAGIDQPLIKDDPD